MKMPELKISGRLSLGFGVLVLVLIAAVGTTLRAYPVNADTHFM